jgi:DNA mismatch repair protein MutS2
MKLFPDSAILQMEFDKVKALLMNHCKTEYAKEKTVSLVIHTQLDLIEIELRQTLEFKLILQSGQYFPNNWVLNLAAELKLLSIPGAMLSADQFLQIRKLLEGIRAVFRWFDNERRLAYPALVRVIVNTSYEKSILEQINRVLDEDGQIKDSASEKLGTIRMNLFRRRNELRRAFDRILAKLNKSGYLADIEESFLNGRRVLALFAEHKRQVKGILHGESDTRKTSFVEPEETIELNNEVFSLEQEERREIYRMLLELTGKLSIFSPLLNKYHDIIGEYDFICAKARLAIDINGNYPVIGDKSQLRLIEAYHPLLLLYNQKNKKPTIAANIELDEQHRILVISGPNAGGKTVTLKTVGLLQLMIQSGLLIPVAPDSELGIFKQLMIHIGDTQSIEFELSTYSSHLQNMKHFMEAADGRTLFFIDELGSGSDPNLGGVFAEVILEELVKRHSLGIVTTHYLNLKVMAGKTPGIINGAMAFDEKNLQPLYKLIMGQPGSSYTFAIAERIGLAPRLIERARSLANPDHFRLDKLLNQTEQDLHFIENHKKELQRLIKENVRLKKESEALLHNEKHQQQIEILKQQNKISEDRITYLKEMERKLKQIIFDWRKAENKNEAIKQMQALLFNQKEKQVNEKVKKKFELNYAEVGGEAKVGDKVMMKKNHQVGTVKELRGKRAVVQVGLVPMTVGLPDLTVIRVKQKEGPTEDKT